MTTARRRPPSRWRVLLPLLGALLALVGACAAPPAPDSAREKPHVDADRSTTSPPSAAAPDSVTIAAVGDMACVPGADVTATTCHQQSVSDLVVGDPAISALLALGDLQYDDGALTGFQGSYDPSFGRVEAITRPAPGNHEYGTAGAAGYFSYFGAAAGDPAKGYYSFDVGTSWHLVALNSNCSVVGCGPGSAQDQWLRDDLAATSRECVLAYWHHPRFSSSTGHGNDTAVAPFWDALSQSGAEIVLSGHDHGYERFAPQLPDARADANGIRAFVVGTGGRSLYPFSTTPQANSSVRVSAFGILELTLGTGTYSWQFVGEGARVLDSGSGTCH